MPSLSTSQQEKYCKLCFQRNVVANSIEEAHAVALRAKTDSSLVNELEATYADTLKDFSSFREVHNTIIGITAILGDDEFLKQDKIRETTSKIFYGFKSIYHEVVGIKSTPAPAQATKRSIRLEPLGLKVFSGDFKEWRTFYDMFNSCIHNDSELSEIDKFRYLLRYLEGEPLALARSLPLTEDNYSIAYTTLVKKYENHRLISTNFWNEIYFCPVLKHDGNLVDLGNLLNTFSENLEALRNLQYPVDQWDFIMFHLLLYKIDSDTRNRFELEFATKKSVGPSSKGQPCYKDLFSFLEAQLRAMQTSNAIQAAVKSHSKPPCSTVLSRNPRFPPKKPQNMSFVAGQVVCSLCKEGHLLTACEKFLARNPHSRFNFAKGKRLCLVCLSAAHSAKDCGASSCASCGYRHHSLLHFTKNNNAASPPFSQVGGQTISQPVANESYVGTTLVQTSASVTLLPTAIVEIADCRGHFLPVRALIDSGSCANFLSEDCFKRLGLSRQKCDINISGIGNSANTTSKGVAKCTIKPHFCADPRLSLKVFVLSQICSQLPLRSIDIQDISYDRDLELADKDFWKPGEIDLLIGAEMLPYIIKSGRNYSTIGQPMFMETIFGWVALGSSDSSSTNLGTKDSCLLSYFSTFESLDSNIKRLWEVESIPEKIVVSQEAEFCESLYQDTHFRNSASKYVVALPFRI